MNNHKQLVKLAENKQFNEALTDAFEEISNFANEVREEDNANLINSIVEKKRFETLVFSSIEATTEAVNLEMAKRKIEDVKQIVIGELITVFYRTKCLRDF